MTRLDFDRADLTAIGVGGILGASLRWLLTSDSGIGDVGWSFLDSPNRSNTVPSNIAGFEPTGSSGALDAASGIPVNTLVVNLLGCLVLGALTLLFARSVPLPRRLLVGAATGFCGSLTTFSTFAVEVAALLRTSPMLTPGPAGLNVRAESDVSSALGYVTLSLAGGALAFWLGRVATHRLVDAFRSSTLGGAE
jgi:CrcB protein